MGASRGLLIELSPGLGGGEFALALVIVQQCYHAVYLIGIVETELPSLLR